MAESVGAVSFDFEVGKNDITNAIKNMGNNALSSGDIIKSNLISQGIIGGFNAVKGAVVNVGSALIDAGKQALTSYKDYEQLVGGVDTLFKENSQTVQTYADNAYKTAGMSANEYMSTITGFSASLLQSLGGDTAKAAEVGNMAVTDMSDNANKMGTSMEMIQNAYQGFAKQNYTMLDNLKLGYGGTKEEMERLLKDAEKLTGVHYDINNLSDVYNAIHAVQGELGITGTTASEASTTIEGSVNMVKSSWQNLLTGIANDNADFGQLVNNFVDSLITAGSNILPRVETIISGIGKLIVGLANKLVEYMPQFMQKGVEILQNLMNGIQQNLPTIMNAVNQVVNTLLTGFIQMLPQIIQMGLTVLVSLAQGIAQNLPTLIPQIINCVLLIVETLLDNIDLIVDAGIQLIIGLAEGLINALPQLIDKIPIIIDKLITALSNNIPKLIEMGITLTIKLAEGLIIAIPQLVSKIPQIMTSLINGYISYYGKLISLGGELIGKLANGILNNSGSVYNAVVNGISGAINWIRGLAGQAWSWGADIIGNIASGIWGAIGKVGDAVKGVANKIKSFLHFSEPDVGPLSDFHTYMPDMMDLMSSGIEDNTGALMKSVNGLASDMSNALCIEADMPKIKGSSNSSNSTTSSNNNLSNKIDNLMSLLLEFIKNDNKELDGGDITIPVYIGNDSIDEIIVTAQQRRALRSGGKS